MTSIPMDLILDILSRLPAKSIRRFLCVSKLWGSMLRHPYFTEMLLTRSLARPRLLFAVVRRRDGEWSFFSSPQPQNTYGKSSLVVGANFHMKLYKCINYYNGIYVSGLIYFPYMCFSRKDEYASRVVCNLNTGQYAILPTLLASNRTSEGYLGFDPIDKQFKVLVMNYPPYDVHHILTLGTEKMMWRKIQCPFGHSLFGEGICFNGAVFYLARISGEGSYGIVCFDVRYEKFMFIDAEHLALGDSTYTQLLNYKGKLGGVSIKYANDGGFPLQLCVWVLEDVEKHEWSKYDLTFLADNKVVKVNKNLSVVGMTATGEIVLWKTKKHFTNSINPFFVFYFNPEKESLLSVEIQGFGELHGWFKDHEVYAFVDHVEDLTFNTMKTTCGAKSISCPPEQKLKPTSTSPTSTNNHQVRTVANLQQQDRRTFESVNKFAALSFLDNDDSTAT